MRLIPTPTIYTCSMEQFKGHWKLIGHEPCINIGQKVQNRALRHFYFLRVFVGDPILSRLSI